MFPVDDIWTFGKRVLNTNTLCWYSYAKDGSYFNVVCVTADRASYFVGGYYKNEPVSKPVIFFDTPELAAKHVGLLVYDVLVQLPDF